MGLSQEELANKLQEKKNLIAKIEREEIKPDKHTARKIEKSWESGYWRRYSNYLINWPFKELSFGGDDSV